MKFLITGYTGLGNFILKTPLLANIHRCFPGSSIDLIYGLSWGAECVLQESKVISHYHYLDQKSTLASKLTFLLRLRRHNYDVLLLPIDSTPRFLYLFYWMIGAKKVIKHILIKKNSYSSALINAINLIYFAPITIVPILIGRHEIDLNIDLLTPYPNLAIDRKIKTYVSCKADDVFMKKIPSRYIAIQASASNGAVTPKTCSPSLFTNLIRRLQIDFPEYGIVLVGDKGDANTYLRRLGSSEFVIDMLGKTSFNQLCNLLKSATLVISHDSAVMHIADAFDTPLIALYGPTDYSRTHPRSNKARVLVSNNSCTNLMYGYNMSEKEIAKRYKDYYCMNNIKVDMVMLAAKKIMEL